MLHLFKDVEFWCVQIGIIYLHKRGLIFPLFPLRNKSVHYVANMVKLKLTVSGLKGAHNQIDLLRHFLRSS